MSVEMNNVELELIKDTFHDKRSIERVESFDALNLYITDDKEIILICPFVDKEFTGESLAKFTTLAEDVFYDYHMKVNVYVLVMPYIEVKVANHSIRSDADFSIRLAVPNETSTDVRIRCDLILDIIRTKIDNDTVTIEDVNALEYIPLRCDRKDRLHYRSIVFDLLARIDNECSISLS